MGSGSSSERLQQDHCAPTAHCSYSSASHHLPKVASLKKQEAWSLLQWSHFSQPSRAQSKQEKVGEQALAVRQSERFPALMVGRNLASYEK